MRVQPHHQYENLFLWSVSQSSSSSSVKLEIWTSVAPWSLQPPATDPPSAFHWSSSINSVVFVCVRAADAEACLDNEDTFFFCFLIQVLTYWWLMCVALLIGCSSEEKLNPPRQVIYSHISGFYFGLEPNIFKTITYNVPLIFLLHWGWILLFPHIDLLCLMRVW